MCERLNDGKYLSLQDRIFAPGLNTNNSAGRSDRCRNFVFCSRSFGADCACLLLSFVLAPLVRLLRRWYLPRSVAVIFSVLLAFSVILSLGALMASQVNQLATDLPQYQSTLREKIHSLRGAATGTGTLERASDVLQELGKELDKPQRPGSPVASPGVEMAGPK